MCCPCDCFFGSPAFLQPLSGSTAGLLLISTAAAVKRLRLFYSHGCRTEWAILQPVAIEKNLSFYSRSTASGCRIAMKFTLKPNHFCNSFIFSFKDPWNITWNGIAQPFFENFHIFLILRFNIIKVDH